MIRPSARIDSERSTAAYMGSDGRFRTRCDLCGDEVLVNAQFQQGLNNEIVQEEQASVDAEAEYHKNFEDVPEVEEEAPEIE